MTKLMANKTTDSSGSIFLSNIISTLIAASAGPISKLGVLGILECLPPGGSTNSNHDNKRALPIIRQRPEWTEPRRQIQQFINFVGLEPQLSDEVHITGSSPLGRDQTERGRIKILIGHVDAWEHEIGMVQNVDRRGLDLKPNSFRDLDPLGHAQVEVE